ncbi:MAG: VOC family protein, partial [Nitrospinota bacterium]
MLRDIHHIGVAVRDLGRAADLYGGALGAELEGREVVAEQGVEVILCRVGGSRIELIAPLNPECAMAKFLEKRGEGVHHIAYHVESVREAIKKLSEAGLKLVDEAPR